MMLFNIVHLDRRYRAKSNFDFRLEFPLFIRGQFAVTNMGKFQNYQIMREWMWENYGPSCERDLYNEIYQISGNQTKFTKWPKWAWHYDTTDNQPFIYIADKEMLSHIQLKWT